MSQFDKNDVIEEAAKSYAKNKAMKVGAKVGAKAAKATGKAAAKAIQAVASSIIGAIGLPAFIVVIVIIIIIIIFLMIIPSTPFSSTMGVDGAYTSDEIITEVVGPDWEADAQQALTQRYNQLSAASFWDDLGNFFSTGTWGGLRETFKTEYADAEDRGENGETLFPGYFGSSNRMIAIINHAFVFSKDDAMSNNAIFFQSPAMKKAKKAAEIMMRDTGPNSYYSLMRAQYPQVPVGHITSKIKKQTNIEEDYVYQACFLVAACSSTSLADDTLDVGVRNILDKAFYITGIDNPHGESQKICWIPTVTPSVNYWEVPHSREEFSHYDYKYEYVEVPQEQPEVLPGEDFVPVPPVFELVITPIPVYTTVYWSEYYMELTYTYSLELDPNYTDLVIDLCNVEKNLPADSPEHDMVLKDQVDISASQLYQFYHDLNVNLGVVGLPLPEYQYTVGERFGCMCAVHAPSGHGGQDLPALNGTTVFAVADGTVTYVQTGRVHNTNTTGREMYGNCVFITHDDGTETRYGHLQMVTVANGTRVSAGTPIGAVGNTGYSFGNHLHLEMRVNGTAVDPMMSQVGILINQYKRQ